MSRCPATTRCPAVSNVEGPRCASRTEGIASLICRINGSFIDRPRSRSKKQRVPTEPTPTTFRAMSTGSKVDTRWARSGASEAA